MMHVVSSISIAVLVAILSYLIGSVCFAMVVSTVFRLGDPKSVGSGNPGSFNVYRCFGKLYGILVLLGDAGKGALVIMLCNYFDLSTPIVYLAALSVFLGHLFPVFEKFLGGKGIATYLGILLALNIHIGIFALLIWAVFLLVFGYSSLSSMSLVCFSSLWMIIQNESICCTIGFIIMMFLVFWRHRANIGRIFEGVEPYLFSRAIAKWPFVKKAKIVLH